MERKQQLKDVLECTWHDIPLVFNKEQWDLSKKNNCMACFRPMYGQSYSCLNKYCDNFHLHKRCAESPTKINLPYHLDHVHPLLLDSYPQNLFCKLCQTKTRQVSYYYRCSSCEFDIHFKCVSPSLVIKDKTDHEHQFNLFYRQNPFICDACGDEGDYASYICFICHLQVHVKCHSLPRIIKVTRHNHSLFYNYLVQKTELQKQDCRVCFQEVKTKYGSYYCLENDCNYIVHVDCALQQPQRYCIVDPENQDEAGEISKLAEPSITSVIEENECGDATKIKHFSHQHYLILSDKVNEDENQYCDGCVRSISGSLFYYCSECDFLLHKSCAELPRNSNHWFHVALGTLKSDGIFKCDWCSHQCGGFSYNCKDCSFSACLKCANISDCIEHPGHKHLLFFYPKYEGKCTACGVEMNDAFMCTKKCDFGLDYPCITLPHVVQHKCDKHFLELSYPDKNDYPEQCYCDICEEPRDPNLWFYHCSICDTSAHRKCALGKYPFIKIGSIWSYEDHPHPLTFVQKIYYYPPCAACGEPCQDLSLECATCNNIVHWDCIPGPRKSKLKRFKGFGLGMTAFLLAYGWGVW